MINPAHLSAERMVGFTQFGTVPMRSSGTALLIGLHRSANSTPLAFLALPLEDAKEFAADVLRMVIAVGNGLPPGDTIHLPGLVEWHPFGTPPDTDRVVLINNEGWPESDKTTLGWFEGGCWYEHSGAWLDADPDSGDAAMPPTLWAEIPRPPSAVTRQP